MESRLAGPDAEGYLLEGAPGIGKSTIAMEVILLMAKKQKRKIFYAPLKEDTENFLVASLWQKLGRNVPGGIRLL